MATCAEVEPDWMTFVAITYGGETDIFCEIRNWHKINEALKSALQSLLLQDQLFDEHLATPIINILYGELYLQIKLNSIVGPHLKSCYIKARQVNTRIYKRRDPFLIVIDEVN